MGSTKFSTCAFSIGSCVSCCHCLLVSLLSWVFTCFFLFFSFFLLFQIAFFGIFVLIAFFFFFFFFFKRVCFSFFVFFCFFLLFQIVFSLVFFRLKKNMFTGVSLYSRHHKCSTGVMIVAHQSFVDYGDGHHHGSSDTNPTANVELCGNDP